MPGKRIAIIPFIHGKLSNDGKLIDPDIDYILDKWLDRHPEVRGREKEISILKGRWTLPQGVRTESIRVSIAYTTDFAGYDPAQDADLYEYFLPDAGE